MMLLFFVYSVINVQMLFMFVGLDFLYQFSYKSSSYIIL
jgi:hypothetical protein